MWMKLLGLSVMTGSLAMGVAPAGAAGLTWEPCTEKALKGLQCTTLTVPKDYDDPSMGTFDLALVRATATGARKDRIGTLFFNPGGPGESGVSLAPDVLAALPKKVRSRFDFVTWDPRGVGRSNGLNDCVGGTYTLPATGEPDWAAVAEQMRASEQQANRQCARTYPDVIPYIGTNNTVRDLERMRQAVGDAKLTYWGTSYGTRIGSVYARMYPAKVRAMLLSSPVAPNADWTSFASGAAVAPDNAIGFLFEVRPRVRATFKRVTEQLATAPLTLPSGASVTHWDVQALVATAVASQAGYDVAAQVLSTTDTALNGRGKARRTARAALDRQPWPKEYPINGGATAFIGCLDLPQRFSPQEQVSLSARFRADAPIFGFGTSQVLYFCNGVDVAPDPVATGPVNSRTPMLIMGSTRDALTSYEWATDVARTFRNNRVMTYVGTVHTPVYSSVSACLDDAATRYLLTTKRPAVDTSCRTTARR